MKLLKHPVVRRFGALVIVCVVTAGCGGSGPETSPVTGKVTYKDGSPVPGGTIIFSKDNIESRGKIKPEDGTYALTSVTEGDGAQPGDYKVYFQQPEEISGDPAAGDGTALPGEGDMPAPGTITTKKLFAEKYLAADTSGFNYTVKADANENVDFQVEKP